MQVFGKTKGLLVKLVLSRKGFDSSFGGVASPIMPDGSLLSLPIPSKKDALRYGEVRVPGGGLGTVVTDLTVY